MTRTRTGRRAAAFVVGAAVVLSSGLLATSAAADTVPANPALPATVSADGLPTAQINGVVWTQEVVGSTVFAGGNFTTARPAGSAAGVNEVARTDLMSYNLTTGVMTSWAPVLNGQVKDLAVSPDGKTLYAVGQFTQVNGQTRYRVAAFDTATGNLLSFAPAVNATVNAVTASSSNVVIGGIFSSVSGVTVTRAAELTLSGVPVKTFTPDVEGGSIQAAVMAPDGNSVVIGGAFTTVNGSSNPGYGLARLDLATGALLPLPVNTQIRDAGINSAVLSLNSDGTNFYGSGYHFGGGGNMEGSFSADWATGTMTWVEDCHGDTYSVWAGPDVVYSASHKHYCGNSGGFPQTTPWTVHRATATGKVADGVNTADIYGYPDHAGQPKPDLLYWFPDINTGTFTGIGQGAWSVSGNSQYVVYGGEFTRVNNVGQQGLVRFAVPSIAPNKVGPQVKGSNWPLDVKSFIAGQVRIGFQTNWDEDNETLTYNLYRQSTSSTPLLTKTVTTPFWMPQTIEYTDTGVTPGSTTRYEVVATDPKGNSTNTGWIAVTVDATDTLSPYASDVFNDGASNYWRLGDPVGSTTAADWAGMDDDTLGTGVTLGTAGAIAGDANRAATFNGSSSGLAATSDQIVGPQVFSIEAWFSTTTTAGGKIVGFGNANTGNSSNYDRHVYMTANGQVNFGVYPGSAQIITSSKAYNDGKWHHVVATLSSAGMALFVDDQRVATNAGVTSAQSYSGYWRIGGDSAWSGANYFAGSIDDVAIYPTALTRQQVDAHWVAAGRVSTLPQAPADSYGAAVFGLGPDVYWRLNETSGSTAVDSGSNSSNGTYSGGVTLGAAGALVGVSGNTAVRFTGASNGLVASNSTYTNPTTYSEELWFNTTDTIGGKLIGFGDARTGTSSSYDRHVFMNSAGQLTFGTWTGTENEIVTPGSYNDGKWHHMVATQSSDGMKLYVDGALVGTNAQAGAQSYTGYWRVGGDTSWDGVPPWFSGSIDEVAIYPIALTQAQVTQHYTLGSGSLPPNQLPIAAFTTTSNKLSVTADGTGSSDLDGTIAGYAWTTSDGQSSTAAAPTFTFGSAGTYTITLTVTDNRGGTGTVSHDVTVVANQPPVASFTTSVSGLSVSADGTGSSDPDGTIAGYAWTADGGQTSSDPKPTFTFPDTGTYTIGLTVTDNDGATNTTSHQVSVVKPANQPPVASFTVSVSGLSVNVNGSASSDPDGSIASYVWSTSDGQSASGSTAAFTFASAGTYTVGLTVTDNLGATAHVDHAVTVTAGGIPANALAWDSFGRTVSNGWGSSEVGGAWTVSNTTSQYSVNGSSGVQTPKSGYTVVSSLASVSSASTDVAVTVSPDKLLTGGGAWVTVEGRTVGSANYGARLKLLADGTVALHLMVSGTPARGGVVTGLTYGAGDQLRVRLQVTGTSPTTIQARVWKVGTTEPSAWTYTYSDSTAALQTAGGLALQTYLPTSVTNLPVAIRFDDFNAVPVA